MTTGGRSEESKMWRASDGVRNFRAPPNDILVLIKLSGEMSGGGGTRKIATALKMDPRAA